MANTTGKKFGGRQKGTPNKVTATVRETFERVFSQLQEGDDANLQTWAEQNPTEFYKLSSKLIPTDVALQGALIVNVVTGVPKRDGTDLV